MQRTHALAHGHAVWLFILALGITAAVAGRAHAQGADPGMDRFVNDAMHGLTESEVVTAACRSVNGMRDRVAQANAIVGQVQGIRDLANVRFRGGGLPTGDAAANFALTGYAKAAQEGSQAERYAAAMSVGSLCNTSETARLQESVYGFIRNVVNRGIERSLPSLATEFAASDSVVTPVQAEVREARFKRLFGRPTGVEVASQSDGDALADTVLVSSYQLASRTDSANALVQQRLRAIYAEANARPVLDSTGRAVCQGFDDRGDLITKPPLADGTCGGVSPGRADQLTVAVSALNASQTAMLSQIESSRMDIERVRLEREMRERAVQRALTYEHRRW